MKINEMTLREINVLIENAENYRVSVTKDKSGAIIIDAGVNTIGSLEAGCKIAEITMASLGKVAIRYPFSSRVRLPYVEVLVPSHPAIVTLASQLAGWNIRVEDFSAIGSGPARALARKPKKLFKKLEYKDSSNNAILVLECSSIPRTSVLESIAESCNVSPASLYVIVVPTNSIAGSVQISARVVETAIFRLNNLGFNPLKIVDGIGYCPIAPPLSSEEDAMCLTNTMLIYGGSVYLTVKDGVDQELVNKAISKASPVYGKPFKEIFEDAEHDFYKIPPETFATSELTIFSKSNNKLYHSGKVNEEVIIQALP